MITYFVWTGDETWNETGRKIKANTAQLAAERFAEKHVVVSDDEEDDREVELEVFVVSEDRPHRIPARFTIKVDVQIEIRREVDLWPQTRNSFVPISMEAA